MNAGGEQAFRGVNIAYPHHDLAGQQRLLDGHAAPL